MHKNSKLATIILLSYNSHEDLAECIPSLMGQTYLNNEIIVVDNASTDSSVEFIKTNYPDIKLIETGENLGYPSGNNVGFEHAEGEYIAVLNPDTIVDTKWLAELIKPLEHDPQIALTTSKILIYDRKTVINTCANSPHYTGLDFCRGLYDAASEYGEIEEVGAISGCSFVIRKEALNHLAGFDSDLFLYLEKTLTFHGVHDLPDIKYCMSRHLSFIISSIYRLHHGNITIWNVTDICCYLKTVA